MIIDPKIADYLKNAVDQDGKLDFSKIDQDVLDVFRDPTTGLLDIDRLE